MKIYWYAPEAIFASFSNKTDNPSYRMRCWNIHNQLIRNGIHSEIIDKEGQVTSIDKHSILVLMSFGEEEHNLAKRFDNMGGSVIHDYCENIRDIPILEKTKKLCKYIVCCSTYLYTLEKKEYGSKVLTIKDHIEEYPFNITNNVHYQKDKLEVVWCGMGGNAYLVENLIKPIIESNGMEYVQISNLPTATFQWDFNLFRGQMASCDVAICPQDHWNFPAKSNVKVTTAMALGLPVIASPIQSYEEIIIDGLNGFIGHTLEDWDYYLNRLKDKYLRESIVKKGFDSIKPYRFNNIYQQWLTVFRNSL